MCVFEKEIEKDELLEEISLLNMKTQELIEEKQDSSNEGFTFRFKSRTIL